MSAPIIKVGAAYRAGAVFACHICQRSLRVPTASWANSFVCGHCNQEYMRELPEASQADLNHLFGAKPSPYPDFGLF